MTKGNPVRSYRDLLVWRKAMDLVAETYEATGRFPASERFGLTGQLRRCAVSVAANIAEGHGRARTGDFLHHLSIARGSIMELETQMIIAQRLNFVDGALLQSLLHDAEEISRMLAGLITSLRARQTT
jgi:four helix bundle protein